MSNKTRVLNVRVVGFSAPERQMLNSIFLLSVAPARQIGYKLWNPEAGIAPDMYLLDGDSESAVASWQATFASTSDRTLVVGAKNQDLGVASASRPLGLKVVGAMDRLAIALKNAQEAAVLDVSAPGAGGTLPTSATLPTSSTLPTGADSSPAVPRQEQTLSRMTSGMTAQQPALSASMNALPPMSSTANTAAAATMTAAAQTLSPSVQMTANTASATHLGAVPGGMTAAAPAANVLPNVTLQPNIAPTLDRPLDRSINEKPVPEKTVDRILSEKAPDKTSSTLNLQMSGVTPLSPSALSAAVAPSASRVNLRVVTPPPPASPSPLASSLPAAARIADAPMQAPPLAMPRIAEAPMHAPPTVNPPPPAPAMPAATAASSAPAAQVPNAPAAHFPSAPTAHFPSAPTAHFPSAPTARHEEHNFRVLVVDDSPLMRTFMQNKLSPYGISPEFAASGEEALFKISKNQHFDLIFLDVMLPGMDGYDVCKMIKKNKDNSLMKVVMLTSKDKTFDKIRGTMAGCDGYLTKPVDEMKLRAIIERHSVTEK